MHWALSQIFVASAASDNSCHTNNRQPGRRGSLYFHLSESHLDGRPNAPL